MAKGGADIAGVGGVLANEKHEQANGAPDRVGGESGLMVGPEELAEMLGAFDEVAGRLRRSHEMLSAEVAQLREQLRQADEKLERSRRLAALGEMAAGIAHEIRNPLGSIGLYASMLVDDLADRPNEQQLAVKIGRAVRGLNAIVTDVLAFSGRSSLRMGASDAVDIARQAIELSKGLADDTGVEVVLEPDASGESEAIELWCDIGKVCQALVNLLRNGIEAAGEAHKTGLVDQPCVWVEVRRRDDTHQPSCVFRVRDNGTGMDMDVRERMFNPFFTTREVGTGLGLAIVHRIVDAHHGSVTIRNNNEAMGRGVCAEMVLPMTKAEKDDQAAVCRGTAAESMQPSHG